jgi:hypothetical protein
MRNVNAFIVPLALVTILSAAPAYAAIGVCGVPQSDAAPPTAADALHILNAAVDNVSCNICVCDVNSSADITTTDALLTLQAAVGLPVTLDCTECEAEGLACPAVAQFALFARIRGVCTSNTDCAAFSVCDPSIGRCRTSTDSDNGWTGYGHNVDTNDPVPARLFLDCDGPAPCGQCEITGHDPSLGNCRCESDNRTRCFTVAGPDTENCGGSECVCNFGPPMPVSAGSIPLCVLNTLSGQPGGEANVDDGSGTVDLHLAEKIHLGASRFAPCPICMGDPTPADGVRGGTCVGGQNDTDTCDAQAYNATFPPPTGGFYSLDCFPLEGANVTGQGLRIETELTTGHTELHANLPCGEAPFDQLECPCLVCSGDTTIPCNSHEECAEAGAGTCSSAGQGAQPLPNDCEDFLCSDIGNEEGECTTGPDDNWCDGIVRADGSGLIGCGTNEDCAVGTIGVDAGECALVTRRPCFLDPIEADGAPHPVIPSVGATFCLPPTLSDSINSTAGFPGPGRLRLQTLVTLFCKSNPTSVYTPGVGNCPAPP